MNKKEKLNNIPKDKYIYQRYKGIITKYIQKEEYYIDCATGIGTKIEEHLLLGKISDNITDLIEVGDIVKDKDNKYEVAFVKEDKIYCNDYNLDDSLITLREQDIKTILTKEQFEANCYKVGGE